ncbi:MAG TPA: 2'-5' RNA ligase family protein [Marmoricola sp.]|nr:2'-5' RNA ligase family protein [Marmoricola sp.]
MTQPVTEPVTETGLTGILIPVREAETVVRPRAMLVQPELLPADDGSAAHITLLAPFMPVEKIDHGVLSELTDFFSEVTAFGFELTAVTQFPGGTVYLTPEPPDVFRRLTLGLHRLFPEFPPYGGEFDDVVPHLSVPMPPDEDAARLRTTLRRRLPIHAHATEARLVHITDRMHTLGQFRFGTAAA